MTPNQYLMQRYGTDAVAEKTAGELPLVERISAALLNASLGRAAVRSRAEQRDQAALLNMAVEEAEKGRLRPATAALEHQRVRPMIARGLIDPSMVPVGFDEGMVRLAAIAQRSGRVLAKLGGIGGGYIGMAAGAGKAMNAVTQKLLPGWKGQAALGAGALGAAYLGSKAVKGGLRTLGSEGHAKNYGAGNYQVPFGVNEYGHPQVGTPLY